MSFEKQPINTNPKLKEGGEASDFETNTNILKQLHGQISNYKKEVGARGTTPEDILKNKSDEANIAQLRKDIEKIQNGEPVEEE
jgi:hypothetical protein